MTAKIKAKPTRKPAAPRTPEQEIARLKTENKELKEIRTALHQNVICLTSETAQLRKLVDMNTDKYESCYRLWSRAEERCREAEAKLERLRRPVSAPSDFELMIPVGGIQ